MRIVLIMMVVLAAPALAGGCAGAEQAGAGRATEVAAGFYPLAFAAEEVGGDRVEVMNLTPPGAEPHDLELSVRDAERVRSADVVLLLGGGFQPALEAAAEGAEGRVIDLLAGLAGVRTTGGDRATDPHVWLDPRLFAEIVDRIGSALDAPQAAGRLIARLRRLDGELERGLARCDRHDLVTSHAAFGYLARRYGLDQSGIAGLAPEAEIRAQELERLAALVRARRVTTIFVEPLASRDAADTLARETGAKIAVLDPIEGLTQDELARGDDYFTVMRRNLAALRQGLGCR